MAVSCMHHASGYNYGNSSFILELAMGQIGLPLDTERISSSSFIGPLMFLVHINDLDCYGITVKLLSDVKLLSKIVNQVDTYIGSS